MLVMPFADLRKNLAKEAKGVVLNPGGFRLQFTLEQLERIMRDFI